MKTIKTVDELEAIYGAPASPSITKVAQKITPLYKQWIDSSRFVVLSTVGPEGTDASPRGDAGPVVRIADEKTILLPDWRGNNRLDSLRNIIRDERVSLMFVIPGCNNVVRVNGTAVVSADTSLTAQFEHGGRSPKTVIVITLGELYFQCAKALMRSGLWSAGDESSSVPTAGQFLKEMQEDFDAERYDAGYPDHAKDKMW